MKTSELIKELQSILAEHGDLNVRTFKLNGSYEVYSNLSVQHLRIKVGREQKTRTHQSWDAIELKGEKVVIV